MAYREREISPLSERKLTSHSDCSPCFSTDSRRMRCTDEMQNRTSKRDFCEMDCRPSNMRSEDERLLRYSIPSEPPTNYFRWIELERTHEVCIQNCNRLKSKYTPSYSVLNTSNQPRSLIDTLNSSFCRRPNHLILLDRIQLVSPIIDPQTFLTRFPTETED